MGSIRYTLTDEDNGREWTIAVDKLPLVGWVPIGYRVVEPDGEEVESHWWPAILRFLA